MTSCYPDIWDWFGCRSQVNARGL